MEKRIIFATGNQNKMEEIHMILADLGMPIYSMKEAGIDIDLVCRLLLVKKIDTKLLLFQIPDMPVTGKDFIIIAQEFLNGFSLGG